MYKFARRVKPQGRAEGSFFPGRKRVRAFLEERAGTSIVEFTLVLPVFLIMVLGIYEFGRALKTWNEVNHALTRAVRLVNVNSSTTPTEIAAAMRDYLKDVKTTELKVAATPTTITGTDYIKISVDFPYQISLPFTEIAALTIKVDTIAPILSSTK
ncbi:MAG: pilus assembly protein [Roseibium sp.]|nr:pilus assembly protein [Roseibium sp.]